MPRKSTKTETEAVTKAISPLDQPERFKLGESGYLGLPTFGGVPQTELKRELNFPQSIQTFKQMQYHSAINSALTLFDNILDKAEWTVVPPKEATEAEKKQTEIIAQSMHDMEHSWSEFIKDALSANIFGFSVHEKVYRKRFKSNGSKYDDGVIAWKKLPIRSQESIAKFIFSEDGNDILGVQQNLSGLNDPYGRYTSKGSVINIPASKMLLFRTGKHKGDPFGKSPLRQAYLSWRYLQVLEELEAVSVQKDVSGVPILKIPPQYMSADASDAQKLIYEYYKSALRNLQQNSQSGFVLPSAYDPDTKQPLFELSLLSMDGKKAFDIDKIKAYYKNAIFTSLQCDLLILGQGNTGSFALAQFKNSVTASAAEALAKMICEVINRDLIKQTYELNGWDTSRMCSIDFDGLDTVDLETFSKFIQRVKSVGLLPRNLDVVNSALSIAGMDVLPENTTQEQLDELLGESTSRASDGLATAFEGTRTTAGSGDDNSSNMDNVA